MLTENEVRAWLVAREVEVFNALLKWPASEVKLGCVSAFRSLAESRDAYARLMRGVQEACGHEGGALEPEHVIDHVRALRAKADGTAV